MGTNNARIAVEELKTLSGFWTDKGDALSLYLQVRAPSELSHREEVIVAKETIQRALGSLKGRNGVDPADVRRVMEAVAEMKGNGGRAKVIFACRAERMWREYDLPGEFASHAQADSAFTLAPLLSHHRTPKRYCIALADRNRARLLLLEDGKITEHSQVLDEDKEKIRTTGTGKSARLERQKEEQVKKHYQFLAEHLLHFYEHKDYDCLMIGCREETWPEIEAALHSDLKRILIGRFAVDPGLAPAEEIRAKAQAFVNQHDREEEERLVDKAVAGAATRGLGAVGLRNVMLALERGEVHTLLWPAGGTESQHAASLCEKCGHLETRDQAQCRCGARMRRFARAEEAVLRHALGRSIEIRRIRWAKLPPPDGIAACLRFRAETGMPRALAS